MASLDQSPESEIRRRIAAKGKITFAEFMDVALYHPSGGYYTSPAPLGAAGDFFTSPLAHPAFGALLAIQIHRMWELLECPPRFDVIEMGAGTGVLARDILDHVSRLSEAYGRSLRYLTLDRYPAGLPSASSLSWQRVVTNTMPLKGVVGCLISNELVDSFPVHRFQIVKGDVAEIFVTLDDLGRLTEVRDEPSDPEVSRRLEDLKLDLPEGYRGEINLNIRPWLEDVADSLERGFVLTIDYGFRAEQLYSAGRSEGTLKTAHEHIEGRDPYQRIGGQDITAHVDFSTVSSEGEAVGLRTLSMRSQRRFLRDLGFDDMLTALRVRQLPQRAHDANAMAMLQLVSHGGLGGFRVLVQERGTGIEDPGELLPVPVSVADIEVPLLRPYHVPLLEGRYPHLTWEPQEMWPRDL